MVSSRLHRVVVGLADESRLLEAAAIGIAMSLSKLPRLASP